MDLENLREFGLNISWRFNKYKEETSKNTFSDEDIMGF